MTEVAGIICQALGHKDDDKKLGALKERVHALCAKFPLYPELG